MRSRSFLLLVLAGVCLVVGAVVLATRPESASFGWFAYGDTESGVLFVTWTIAHTVGAGFVLLGLLLTAALTGYRLGQRPSSPHV